MNLLHTVGARPNFMKAAPVMQSLAKHGHRQTLVHTGQHYDWNMSDVFFQQLNMPEPDVNLGVGSGSHAQQTGEVMVRLETVLLKSKPDAVFVYGDVNSTLATALVCAKMRIPVAHVEAGLRAFDRTMPEEINRLLTDQISDMLFTPSSDADENLLREGICREKIFLVGNVMIDTLCRLLPVAAAHLPAGLPDRYALVTLHRPANVDDALFLKQVVQTLSDLSKEIAVVFPAHPRTRQRFKDLALHAVENGNFHLLEPQPYLAFLALQQRATLVITDSGGIQEETTFLRIPCLTVRENTERPATLAFGTNTLVGKDMTRLSEETKKVLLGRGKKGTIPPLWDGHAAERIAEAIAGFGTH
jgi:UDP-N-acetylglucosamine 2-epimerase (non-hydrolysing)